MLRSALEDDFLHSVPIPLDDAGDAGFERRSLRQATDCLDELLPQVFLIGRDLLGRLPLLVLPTPLLELPFRLPVQIVGHHFLGRDTIQCLRQDAKTLARGNRGIERQPAGYNGDKDHISFHMDWLAPC